MMLGSLWCSLPVLALAILSVESKNSKVFRLVRRMAFYNRIPSIESQLVKVYSYQLCLRVNRTNLVIFEDTTLKLLVYSETTSSVNTLSLGESNPDLLPQFVEEAQKNGVKALVSIGGWSGSLAFSTNVGSAQNRTAFVKTVTDFAKKYKLDGLDFDWEFPGESSIGCNAFNKDDSGNFLSFLQELRRDPLGSKLILSAITAILPFIGPDGKPLSDVSGFGEVLDFIEIMNYDLWGSWSPTIGPNSPLNDTCAASQDQAGSAVSAVQSWNKAGIPLNKIVLGVAAYGRSFLVPKANAFVTGSTGLLAPYPKFNATDKPTGDSWDGAGGVDKCGNAQSPGGTINFWGLIELGYLYPNGSLKNGNFFRYDNCSQTPYVYNASNEIMVSFDNAASFAAKGKFIQETMLRGFSMWEAGGDSNDILLDSIRNAGGYN